MKTQEECWKALLDGKTLVNINNREVKLRDGQARTEEGDTAQFTFPKIWSIKEEPKMYCRFKRIDESGPIELAFSHYVVGSPLYETYKGKGWIECEHITFEEIK